VVISWDELHSRFFERRLKFPKSSGRSGCLCRQKRLEAKLDSKHVKTRQVQDTILTYVEAWHVIAEANRIFGYDAWDRRTLTTNCVWSGMANRHHAAAYIAKVRIL
jgi:Rad52/22 family double-strand break repair protein